MKIGRNKLRNKIEYHLNRWQQLGCKVLAGNKFIIPADEHSRIDHFLPRFIFGCDKNGKMILIYPNPSRFTPRPVCLFMQDFEALGAAVGIAHDIGDAWDIVAQSTDYKRKKRTYHYQNVRRKSDGEE